MAKKKTSLALPPTRQRMIDPSTGFVLEVWRRWFNDIFVRSGGSEAYSNSDLSENNTDNSNSIEELKENININIQNIEKLDKRLAQSERDITTIENAQDNDHTSIVANSQNIELIKQNITTIQKDIDTLKIKTDNIDNKVNKIKGFYSVTSLPVDPTFANKFVLYAGSICYSTDGSNWFKVSDNSSVT